MFKNSIYILSYYCFAKTSNFQSKSATTNSNFEKK